MSHRSKQPAETSASEYYVARQTLCQLFELKLGYDSSDYADASPVDVEIMYRATRQLDMVFDTTFAERAGVADADGPTVERVRVPAARRIFVHFTKSNNSSEKKMMELLTELGERFRPRLDTLVLVLTGDTIPKARFRDLNNLWHMHGYNVVIHPMSRLLFNALDHESQAPHINVLRRVRGQAPERIQDELPEESAALEPAAAAVNPLQTEGGVAAYIASTGMVMRDLPDVSRFDTVAALLCARPDDIVHYRRASPTAILADVFRKVVCDLIVKRHGSTAAPGSKRK